MSAHHISLDSAPQRAHRFWGRSGRCAPEPPYVSVPEAACTVRVPPATAARSGRGRFSAARWEPAMLRIIQANDLALSLNVLAVCAVFVFVGALLLGAF
jgi:hypothetical protein